MELKDIDLVSVESAKLVGDFSARLPSQEEAADSLGITLTEGFSNDLTDTSAAQKLEDDKFSISNRTKDGFQGAGVDIEDSVEFGIRKVDKEQLSAKDLEGARLKREMKIYRFSGELKMAVPASAFGDNENLAKYYPKDDQGWCWIPIKLKDTKFSSISEEANQELLARGKSRMGRTEQE